MTMFKITETKQKTSEILKEMRSKFDVWCYYDNDILDEDFPVPTEMTTRYFKMTVEADEEFKNKSANRLEKEGINGITLRERLLMELQYFDETGNHLDVDNATLCSGSRYSGGDVPSVLWNTGLRRVCVDWYYPSDSRSGLRAREVSNPVPLNLEPFATSDLERRIRILEAWMVEHKNSVVKLANKAMKK